MSVDVNDLISKLNTFTQEQVRDLIVGDVLGEIPSRDPSKSPRKVDAANRHEYLRGIDPAKTKDPDEKKLIDVANYIAKFEAVKGDFTEPHQSELIDELKDEYIALSRNSKGLPDFAQNSNVAIKKYEKAVQDDKDAAKQAAAAAKRSRLKRRLIKWGGIALVGAVTTLGIAKNSSNDDSDRRPSRGMYVENNNPQQYKQDFEKVKQEDIETDMRAGGDGLEGVLAKYKFTDYQKDNLLAAAKCINAFAANPSAEISLDAIKDKTIRDLVEEDIDTIRTAIEMKMPGASNVNARGMQRELLENYNKSLSRQNNAAATRAHTR